MASAASGRSPLRRHTKAALSSSQHARDRPAVPPLDLSKVHRPGFARKGKRFPLSRYRRATVLCLVGTVCALALLGYGSVLTGVKTSSRGKGRRRPGRGGQGAIYGSRGGAGVGKRHDDGRRETSRAGPSDAQAALNLPGEDQRSEMAEPQSSKAQKKVPVQPADDDEVPAKPDDLVEIGRKAQKAKGPVKGEKPRKSEGNGEGDNGRRDAGLAARNLEENETGKCDFRPYPPNRYYGLNRPLSEQPDFLSQAVYIRGQVPKVLSVPQNDAANAQLTPQKVCIDSSSWDPHQDGRRPFSDGQNPSLASLASNPYILGIDTPNRTKAIKQVRLDPKSVSALGVVYGTDQLDRMYLGITLVGNAQCKWKMTPEITDKYGFSPLDETPDRRTLILVLDEHLKTIGQATLKIELDANWGKGRKAVKARPAKGGGGGCERTAEYFDDPRLFFHDEDPYVLYRQGPRFGYNDQIQNRLHFEVVMNADGTRTFAAYIKASETFTVCCGRNIALISEDGTTGDTEGAGGGGPTLRALTWVDPVTVVDVDLGKDTKAKVKQEARRRLSQQQQQQEEMDRGLRRRLKGVRGKKERKSDIHGTNGYMVPLQSTSELLGIAHFHRPENRDTSDYALHGHHYTHALFTIARGETSSPEGATAGDNGTGRGRYRLKRLSNEFVFQSMSPTLVIKKKDDHGDEAGTDARLVSDADIIQFASGLDLVGSDTDGRLLLSYGINDCEGAALFINMKMVQEMLLKVPEGKEVVDLMAAPAILSDAKEQ